MPRIGYISWTPTLIEIGLAGKELVLHEPPQIVFNREDRIVAIGQEAERAATEPGNRLYNFPDMAAVGHDIPRAATMLRYYWYPIGLNAPQVLLAAWLPWLRYHLAIHVHDGAEVGLTEAIRDALSKELLPHNVRSVSFLVGPPLSLPIFPTGVTSAHQWLPQAPSWLTT